MTVFLQFNYRSSGTPSTHDLHPTKKAINGRYVTTPNCTRRIYYIRLILDVITQRLLATTLDKRIGEEKNDKCTWAS